MSEKHYDRSLGIKLESVRDKNIYGNGRLNVLNNSIALFERRREELRSAYRETPDHKDNAFRRARLSTEAKVYSHLIQLFKGKIRAEAARRQSRPSPRS